MDNQEINDALDMAVEVAISDTYDDMLGRPMQACINLNRSLELNRKARQHFEQVIVLEPLEDLCVDEPELLQQAFDITNEVIDDSYLSPSEIIGISNRLRQLQQTKRCIYDKRVRNLAIDLLAAYIQNWLVEQYYHSSII